MHQLPSEQDIGGMTMNEEIRQEIERLFAQFNVETNEGLTMMLIYMVRQKIMDAQQELVTDFINRLEGTK